MNSYLLFIFATIVLLLAGCSSTELKDWTPRQQHDRIVWADDGTEVAITMQSYEEKSGGLFSSTTDKRNFKHQLVVQRPDGSGRRTITDWLDFPSGELFYMKPAGYLVVETLLENGRRQFDKISQDGKLISIFEEKQPYQPCQGTGSTTPAQVNHRVIPSPDGQQLIEVYSPTCGQVTVEFLYANNLNFIDSQTFKIDQPMTALWHPNGYVILVSNKLDKAWKFAAQTPPIPIEPPPCLTPVTTSSNISLDRQLVYFEGDKIATKPVGPRETFGCQ
jgi:hypothetical protein